LADDYVVEDGGEVRVPVMLCDADSLAGFRPGFVPMTWKEIAQRRAAFDARFEMDERAREAWRDGKRRREPDPDPDDDVDDANPRALSIRARDAYVRSLADAPSRVLPDCAPDRRAAGGSDRHAALSAPSAASAPQRPEPDDPQAERDAAWNSYRDQLGSAWKAGPGPAAAAASAAWKGPGA
jgi:hypothetical protein